MTNALLTVLRGLRRIGSIGEEESAAEGRKEEKGTKQKMDVQGADESPPGTKTRRKSLRSNDLETEPGSKPTPSQTENNNSVWFYFDLSRRFTDYNVELPIQKEKGSTKYKPPSSSGSTKAVKIQAEKVALENNVVAPSEDPLADEVYGAYFRRKEREEKRIQTIERDKNFMEIDRLETFKEELDGPNWKKDLRKITHIDDPLDNHELEEKRKLTLAEIKIYIDRYKEWKAREVALKSTKHEYHLYIDPPPPPSKSPAAPSSPVKQTSKKKHTTNPSTNISPKPKKFTSFYENPTLRPKFNQLTRPSHHQLRGPHLAFGQPMPDLIDEIHPFDIPEDWKTNKPKRIKLVTR